MLPESLVVYYCPICKVGTGDRAWHKVGRAGLIPQTQEEHTCVKVDVSELANALLAVSDPEPDEPLYDNPGATQRKDQWNTARIAGLQVADKLRAES